jgi:hypothetical protein
MLNMHENTVFATFMQAFGNDFFRRAESSVSGSELASRRRDVLRMGLSEAGPIFP